MCAGTCNEPAALVGLMVDMLFLDLLRDNGRRCRQNMGQSPDKAKLDRIAIVSTCFSSILKSPLYPDDPKRTLDVMDLPDPAFPI